MTESTDDKAGGEGPSQSLVTSAEEDEVFHWGREVDVDWRMVGWVTFRDHVGVVPLELLDEHFC